MTLLILRSWWLLLFFEPFLRLKHFRGLYRIVREKPVRSKATGTGHSVEELRHAMDLACVFYFKRVLCLQRSAAATLLLRGEGWPAEMIIGVQMLPFLSHAWVEINGTPVNDKSYVRQIYQVLEQC